MNIIDRIEVFRKEQNISQQKLCESIGYSKGAYTNAKTRGGDLVGSTLFRLCTTYPILNIEWVLTGNGEMLKSKNTNSIQDLKECLDTQKKLTIILIEKEEEIKRLKGFRKSVGTK